MSEISEFNRVKYDAREHLASEISAFGDQSVVDTHMMFGTLETMKHCGESTRLWLKCISEHSISSNDQFWGNEGVG